MILLRHGQSAFNVHFEATRQDPGIADPKLTEHGHAQALMAAKALEGTGIRQILASPYTRALQTAAPIVARLNLPLRIHAQVRERFHFTCDIGSPRTALEAQWPAHDFSHLEETWWPSATESTESVTARAQAFAAEMRKGDLWQHTLVVSHWAFILALTGESLENGSWMRFEQAGA